MTRTNGSQAFPCLVRSHPSGSLDTYVCNIPVPTGAFIEEVLAYGNHSGTTGYLEAVAFGQPTTSFGTTCWASTACAWQTSQGMPATGGVTLTLHSGSHAVSAGTRYLIAFALTAPAGTVRAYGFRVRYNDGAQKYLHIAANSCMLQI
jgi:hypothetical protein